MAAGLTLGLAGCSGDDARPTIPTAPAVVAPAVTTTSIDVLPVAIELAQPGDTQQLTAQARVSDGTTRDVTRETTWLVVDERVATISSAGLVTARAFGSTTFFAKAQEHYSLARGIGVSRRNGPLWAVDGVVRDARTKAPVVGAEVSAVDGPFAGVITAGADGNGYFRLGALGGPMTLRTSAFGYAYGSLSIDVTAAAQLDIKLAPNPGPFIERTFIDRFTADDIGVKDYRIVTRDGVIDAVARNLTCDYNGYYKLQMELRRGDAVLDADLRPQICAPRVRTVVAAGEYVLGVKGSAGGGDFRVTYRESR